MKIIQLLLAFCFSLNIAAQTIENFEGLKAQGNLPVDFTTLSQEKYEKDRELNTDKSLDKEFFLSTRFLIDELLLSGQMLFNDPLTTYLNDVARYTLKGEKGLYKELRFYVLKSNIVNAFSTDQGIIVFTTGLLGQLENEAQLAYIIAHEVSHYTEKHVRESYVERQKVADGEGKYRRLGYDSRITEMSIYEKQNEFEADQRGIEIYLKSEYALDEIFSSFEMLLYSDLPFEEIKFDTAFLATDIMLLPSTFFPDTVNEISQVEDYDDENHSHPNIQKRMDAAFDFVLKKETKGDLQFKVSEDRFHEIRELARFEGVNLHLSNRNYADCLYNVFLLKRKYPDNRFLDLSLVKCLYGMTKYKNAGRFREVVDKPKKIEGERFNLYLMLNKLTRQQLTVMALRHAHDMAKKYTDDEAFMGYEVDLKKELALNARFDYEKLLNQPYDPNPIEDTTKIKLFDIEDSIAKIEASDLSKYQKIKRKKELRLQEEVETGNYDFEDKFHLFALNDLVRNEDLIGELKGIEKMDDENQNESGVYSVNGYRHERNNHPGIKKVVVVDPIFESYNTREKREHSGSEDKKINLGEAFTTPYDNLDVEVKLLDSKQLTKSDVEQYNDLGELYQWMQEVLQHEDLEMIASTHDRTVRFKEDYGTEHYLFSGVYAYRYRKQFSESHFYGMVYVVTIPFVVYDLLKVNNYFELVAFSANLETDEIEFVQTNEVKLKSSDLVIEAYIYDVLYELSKTAK